MKNREEVGQELTELVSSIKETVEQQKKGNDALLEEKFRKADEAMNQKFEEAQKENGRLKGEIEAQKDRCESLEALVKAGNLNATDSEIDNASKSTEIFGEFLRGKMSHDKLNSEGGVILTGTKDAAIMADNGIDLKAMSTDVDPDGGYLHRPRFVDAIVSRNFETSPLRQVARVLRGPEKQIEMLIDDDEEEINNTAEDSASSDTDTAEVGILTISAFKYDTEPQVTHEMLMGSILNVEDLLMQKVERDITRKENTDFVTGNGVGKARGFTKLTAGTSSYQRGTIEQVNSGSTGAVTADGAIDLQGSLHEIYQPNAVWGMKRATYTEYKKLKDTDNQYLFGFAFLANGQPVPQLLGKNVIFMDDMPSIGTDSLSVVYGDFSVGYTIYDRVGMLMIRDIYTNKGRVKFYVAKYTGGDVTNYQALKLQKLSS